MFLVPLLMKITNKRVGVGSKDREQEVQLARALWVMPCAFVSAFCTVFVSTLCCARSVPQDLQPESGELSDAFVGGDPL